MNTSNITQKGQVTIPAEMRKALGLRSGGKVRFIRHGKKLTLEAMIEPAAESLFSIFKATKGRGIRDIDAALEDLRKQRTAAPAPRKRGK
ncbi:MAG: AbrB/MazE/SpoVT family DNA-binding domain-containing protein [Gammaproteobacteria bacterium]|nr:AbrB/MazE/SpoVT family DNA-binding domain-containing protein [Gammaproteobacteria bacterium]